MICFDFLILLSIFHWLFTDFLLIFYWFFTDFSLIFHWFFTDFLLLIFHWFFTDFLMIIYLFFSEKVYVNFSTCSCHSRSKEVTFKKIKKKLSDILIVSFLREPMHDKCNVFWISRNMLKACIFFHDLYEKEWIALKYKTKRQKATKKINGWFPIITSPWTRTTLF